MTKALWNRILSIVMVGLGIYLIFSATKSEYAFYQILADESPSLFWVLLSIVSIGYGVSCIITGFLGLRLKSPVPSLMLLMGYLLLIIIVLIFISLGFLINLVPLLVLWVIAITIIVTSSQKSVLRLYGKEKRPKSMRLIHMLSAVFLLLIILSYGYFRFEYLPRHDYPVELSKANWVVHSTASTEGFDQYKVLNYEVWIPHGMVLRKPIRNQTGMFIDKKKHMVIFVTREFLFSSWARIGEALGEKDDYVFGQKVLNEKVSFVILCFKSIMGPGYFHKIDSPKWKGFIEERFEDYYAYLWSKNGKYAITITVWSKDEARRKRILQEVIGLL